MQLTSDCMEHIHTHDHTHEHGEPFAPAAENLLLDLAMQARDGSLRMPGNPNVSDIAELQEQHGIKEIRDRLGDVYPELGFMGEAAVIMAFAERADALPKTHSRYDHSHGHDDGCGKTHGPVRRTLESLEQKVLGRIRNERIKLVAAAAFRGSSLILCPGDDLAAIGLQMYGAFTGHTGHEGHEHAEHMAILPRGPRIDFAKGTAVISSLPLDVPLRHSEIPNTPAGRMWRECTADPQPPMAAEAPLKPERKLRRVRRLALMGAAAIALVGGGFAAAHAGHESFKPSAPAPAVIPVQTNPPGEHAQQPEHIPPAPKLMDEITVQRGDSQWRIIEKRVQQVLGRKGRTPLINALTHMSVYANGGTAINPSQEVHIPSREVIIKIDRAVQHQQVVNSKIAADVHIINSQSHFGSPDTEAVVERILAAIAI